MMDNCEKHGPYSTFCRHCDVDAIERYKRPPCVRCGALSAEEATTKCKPTEVGCHGDELWPD